MKLAETNHMRIWHEELIPKLCQKHLCGVWRESLGCFKILTENKKGYRNHPAVKEFENSVWHLWIRMEKIRNEMLSRGYHPKELPNGAHYTVIYKNTLPKPWQTLEEQVEILKTKNCKCNI